MATQKSIPAPPPATTSVLGTVAVSSSALPTGAATAANQATEIASLAAIDAGIPAALGTAVMAASMPVTIASDQPPLPISGSITADIQGDYVDDSAFTVATDRGVAVGGTFTTDSIDAGDFGAFKINAKRELFVVQDTAANLNVTVTGTVTANAGTNLNTSLLATAANQVTELASLAAIDAGIPASLGQTTMAASMPVTMASNQIPTVMPAGVTMLNARSSNGFDAELTVDGYATAFIRITSSPAMSGSTLVFFFGSSDGVTYTYINGLKTAADGLASSSRNYTVSDGDFVFDCAGLKFIRVSIGTYSAGTITAKGYVSSAEGGLHFVSLLQYETLVVVGDRLNDTAVANTTNIGALVAVANAAAPTRTESFLGSLRTTLTGDLAVTLDSEAVVLGAGAAVIGALTANQSVNAAQWGGTTVVNGGVAGIVAVGGNVANAVAATANPVPVGGIFTTVPATLTTGQTATMQFTAAQNIKHDLTTLAGTATDTNSGNKSAGTLRVVLATDQPALTTAMPTAEAAPTSVLNGKKTVAVAGTAEALVGSTTAKSVTIKALIANTGVIYVGNSGVLSTNGFALAAGDTISLDIANLATVFVNSSVNGEGVTYLGVA